MGSIPIKGYNFIYKNSKRFPIQVGNLFLNFSGRQFYKCANSACNFFLWAPDPNASTSTQNPQNVSTISANETRCNCGQPAVKRTVNKAGANTGREFYCCQKPPNEGCRFFKWADEVM